MSSSADALAERKASTRASVKSALRRLSDDDMASQSAAISRHVLASLSAFAPDETRAPDAPPLRLGLYVHCAKLREVDTAPLLAAALAHPRAELYLPIVDVDPEKARTPSMRFLRVRSLDDDLEPKTMGIMEPKETLADGAPQQVCVGRADEFASSLATLSKEMFAPAVEVARAALALDIWPRFEETDDWRRIAATL